MPYVSAAQRNFFHTKSAKKAGISKKTIDEFDKASKGLKLPEKKKGKDRVKEWLHTKPQSRV